MMRAWIVVVAVSACEGGGLRAGFDQPDGHCASLLMELEAAIAERGSCSTTADCQLVGGQFDEPRCDCAPFVLACGGLPVGRNAAQLPLARALIEQLRVSCLPTPDISCFDGGVPCECECPAVDVLDCVDGRCVGTATSTCSFDEGFDGGIPG